ncbi:MAG: TonB-dependent receptor, partial [Salinivirgaceae bacterium]|nr:TonB-dependent receptor [Salinivirgaceae bacterium]
YDFAQTHIHSYNDWYKTPVAGGDSVFKQRSADIDLTFNNMTWSVGASYETADWVLKANAGKSFRIPIPKELGADGINYHIFRYERGNTQLDPEVSYQLDVSAYWANKVASIQIEPYLNYFPNYIYLTPTSLYEEGLQLYHYMQAEVLRYGVECQTTCKITRHFDAELKGEYLYAEQLSGEKKGYTLPFSTPWSADAGLKYSHKRHGEGSVGLNVHIVGKQDNIVPPEKPTDGYWTLNLSASHRFHFAESSISLSLHADNLLNKCYYDHTSYYRLIDVPEAGRNFSIMAGWEF